MSSQNPTSFLPQTNSSWPYSHLGTMNGFFQSYAFLVRLHSSWLWMQETIAKAMLARRSACLRQAYITARLDALALQHAGMASCVGG